LLSVGRKKKSEHDPSGNANDPDLVFHSIHTISPFDLLTAENA
jgi:hypothetical protein